MWAAFHSSDANDVEFYVHVHQGGDEVVVMRREC